MTRLIRNNDLVGRIPSRHMRRFNYLRKEERKLFRDRKYGEILRMYEKLDWRNFMDLPEPCRLGADQQVEALTALTVSNPADELFINDVSDTTDDANGSPKKITVANIGLLDSLFNPNGRLTGETGVYVSTSDQTGKTSVLYTGPGGGNVRIGFYDGTDSWKFFNTSEKSGALGTVTSGLPYDVFAYDNSGFTFDLVAWTNGTTRATALATQDGIYVKSGATARRLLGTLYTTSTTAFADAVATRYLWNYYNRVPRKCFGSASAAHAYQSTVREFNAGTSLTRAQFIIGVREFDIFASQLSRVALVSGEFALAGAGFNTTTANSLGHSFTGWQENDDVTGGTIMLINNGWVTPILGHNYITTVEGGLAGSDIDWESCHHGALIPC